MGSIHVVDLYRNFTHIGSARFVQFVDEAGSQPCALIVVILQ